MVVDTLNRAAIHLHKEATIKVLLPRVAWCTTSHHNRLLSVRRRIVDVWAHVLRHFAAVSSAKRDASAVPTAVNVLPTAAKRQNSCRSSRDGILWMDRGKGQERDFAHQLPMTRMTTALFSYKSTQKTGGAVQKPSVSNDQRQTSLFRTTLMVYIFGNEMCVRMIVQFVFEFFGRVL